MAEKKKSKGCGAFAMYTSMFRCCSAHRNRRWSSTGSLPNLTPNPEPVKKRSVSDDTSIVVRPVRPVIPAKNLPFKSKTIITASKKPTRVLMGQKPVPLPIPGNGISGELEAVLYDYQKVKGNDKLVRATSGNVMLYGNLGNLRANKKPVKEPKKGNGLDAKRATANIVKKQMDKGTGTNTEPPVLLFRTLSKRADPEELKELGNKEFSNGRFADALALYDRAISLDPGKASYWSNKAAALTGLGRIIEAACECKEAVRIDMGYFRAHYRLAGLYFRLGEAGKAIHHYKQSRQESNPSDISKSQTLQSHLTKCIDARRTRDWQTMLTESQSAISLGADSAPQIFAWQAEALLKLHKHDEADALLNHAPKFDIEASAKLFSAPVNAYILMIHAQVNMTSGRFDEAVKVSQKAVDYDSKNREINIVSRRTQQVVSLRSRGNELFKASKFREACIAYGDGLDRDPYNAILLCNRAASLSKLGEWEKAVEDCNLALKFRPSYVKARMRRAYCNAKLERWAESVEDYEILTKENPEDEEMKKELVEAKSKLQKKKAELVKHTAPS